MRDEAKRKEKKRGGEKQKTERRKASKIKVGRVIVKALCTLGPKFAEMFARKKINTTSRYVNRANTLPPKLSSIKKRV